MSAELISASGNNASLQGTTVGGSKPLHRFMKGQPKSVGIIVLVLGSAFFTVCIAILPHSVQHISTVIQPAFIEGALLILCGILYIVTEHNPTKKTVTISLALSIVTLLGTCWSILRIIPDIAFYHHSYYYNIHYEFLEDNITESEVAWQSHHEAMGMSIAAIYLFYSIVSAIILIVMSTLAGSALRSTKSQAIVVMTTTATEEPVE
ncbi:uncharacterized protein si:ch1073-291c23.2 isoform X1 [Chelmon rostratus]|uniref:uncharacterized protein si:ch1073-291c23.2 isoform X1 n=1 Tax=Chelmon rostratus TaxID=109905 RepID=UPI001BEB5C83|nr:uncharacterized protein si:ch1073-291c23.2 isoform X1 [Chelmon rostratus]